MTTDKRQLRLLIRGILEGNGIDDLALEARLSDAVTVFFDDTKRGKDPAKARSNILDGMLTFVDRHRQYEAMANRIAQVVRVTPNGSDKWTSVIRFCIDAEAKHGQTIEKYGDWMASDKFNSPKTAKIADNPSIIIDTWIAAFPANQAKVTTTSNGGFYG